MPVPTNTTPETALQITNLPYAITLDAFEGTGPDYDLWFVYEKTVGGYMAVAFALPDPLLTGDYVPELTAWTGTPDALVAYEGIIAYKVPAGVPLDSLITRYYFRVRNTGSPTITESLVFYLEPGPVAAAPAGSFAINDDTAGFPMALVDSTNGEVLQAFPFPSGERAEMLPSGYSLWQDGDETTHRLYGPNFAEITEIAFGTHHGETPISSNRSDTFYIGDRGVGPSTNARVAAYDLTGALVQTWPDLGAIGLFAMAVSLDDTVLYYAGPPSSLGAAIKRWDLVTDVAMTDLAAGVTGYTPCKDILVLQDGTILVGYAKTTTTEDYYVIRYDTDGTVLNTYPLTGVERINRMAHALDDPTSFWVWMYVQDETGIARFTNINVADGAVLSTFDKAYANGGVWAGPTPASAEETLAFSCPFVVPPFSQPAITFAPPTPEYDLETLPTRRLRRAPHLSDENRWALYRRFQIDMRTGMGTVDGQGEDPQVMLRWSDNGGHTWSNEHWTSAGRMGARKTRAIWWQLGRSRTRTFEVTVSDPVAWYLAAAYLDIDPGTGN